MAVEIKQELIIKTRSKSPFTLPILDRTKFFSSELQMNINKLGIELQPIAIPLGHSYDGIDNTEIKLQESEIFKFFKVIASEERFLELQGELNNLSEIEAAYIKPPTEPATLKLNNMQPKKDIPPVVISPNFRIRQEYLNPSPTGVDIQQAWPLPGGKGSGVNIIDIEWGWRYTHEDLRLNQGGVITGSNSADDNHGTAVLGIISGDDTNFGVVGISPEANVSSISLSDYTTSEAIILAANKLQKGDVILIEVHRSGPANHLGNGEFGYIGIEWWPDDFAAIQYANRKGIIVIEPAGNGGQDLDNDIYNIRPNNDPTLGTFPPDWTNPFNMTNNQSGAIMVGAGMPPVGTHNRNSDPDSGEIYFDRGRCFFSNFGSRLDVQGWGWEVTTTGYGDLHVGINRDSWYTDQFSGTSSASPMIVGVIACLQGVLKKRGASPLNSQQAITLLRNTGDQQQDAPGFRFTPEMEGTGYPQQHPAKPQTERIGSRPNLLQLISLI